MFKKWFTHLLVAASLVASGSALAAAVAGKDYKPMAQPVPVAAGKHEVIEFFWYGCPHCFRVEPYVESWAAKLPKNVTFKRVHVMWDGRNDMEGHARIFLALQNMGLDAKYQQAVFNAVQKDGIELRREDVLFDWVKKQGINVEQFKTNYNAFSIQVQLKQLKDLTAKYQIDGVPTFVVDGKWVTSPAMVGSEDGKVTDVINELLAKDGLKAAPAKKK